MHEPVDSGSTLNLDPETGLVPVIVQHWRSGRVLMLGHMDSEALERTYATGRVTFYSRSRRALWTKGETSGHWLQLVEARPDCNADALLVRAAPNGPTCHTGQTSCFGEPARVSIGEVAGELFDLIESRKRERPDGSYTTDLLARGIPRIAQKVAEEAVELSLAAASGEGSATEEAADLLYHALVLLSAIGATPEDVAATLRSRRRVDSRGAS